MDLKEFQADILQSLTSAADSLFRSEDWRVASGDNPLIKGQVLAMLRACSANLTQGMADIFDDRDEARASLTRALSELVKAKAEARELARERDEWRTQAVATVNELLQLKSSMGER